MERAHEILARRQVDRRLATDRGIHLAEQGRRHSEPADPAQIGRGGEPHDVGRRAAAVRDDGSGTAELELAPQPFEHVRRLRRLAAGYSMDLARLDRERMKLEQVFVGDQRPLVRRLQLAQRATRNSNPERGEQHVLDGRTGVVRHTFVQRAPLLVE